MQGQPCSSPPILDPESALVSPGHEPHITPGPGQALYTAQVSDWLEWEPHAAQYWTGQRGYWSSMWGDSQTPVPACQVQCLLWLVWDCAVCGAHTSQSEPCVICSTYPGQAGADTAHSFHLRPASTTGAGVGGVPYRSQKWGTSVCPRSYAQGQASVHCLWHVGPLQMQGQMIWVCGLDLACGLNFWHPCYIQFWSRRTNSVWKRLREGILGWSEEWESLS